MNTTLSLENILTMLRGLSPSNRQWLAEHLVEPQEMEAARIERRRKEDEEFMKELFSTPYDNPMPAEELKQIIRESRQ